jgi:hypothetical protein
VCVVGQSKNHFGQDDATGLATHTIFDRVDAKRRTVLALKKKTKTNIYLVHLWKL